MPAHAIDYQAVIVEMDCTIKVAQTPLEIIKNACLDNWEDFEGNIRIVSHHTGYKRKVPIIIDRTRGIYAFPTHSIGDSNCHWIFQNAIKRISEEDHQTIITFSNNRIYKMDVSAHIINEQIERTMTCVGMLEASR